MDPITSAAVAGLVVVAADAAKETTTKLATIAWGKIKSVLGLASDVPAAEIEAKAGAAIAKNPALEKEIEGIVNDYRKQTANVNRQQTGSIKTGDITAKTALTGQNTFNAPTTFN